jgi:hypothetical protein
MRRSAPCWLDVGCDRSRLWASQLNRFQQCPNVPPFGPAFRHKYFAKTARGKYAGSLRFTMRGDWIFELSKMSPSGVFEWEVWGAGVRDKRPQASGARNPPTTTILNKEPL